MSWFSRVSRKTGVPLNTALDDVMSILYPRSSRAIVSDARSGMDKSVWIYRAVATVTTRIGSLPWHLYKGDKVSDSEAYLLNRPSPMMTGTEFIERIVAWQLLNGTGFVYAEKSPIKGLAVLDADLLRMDHGNLLYRENNIDRTLDQARIVLFPNFSISGQLGLSELRPILDSANMDESSKQVFNNQMSGGGLLSGLFSTDIRLSTQELAAAKASWEEKYGGIGKAGGIGFLGAGFKFQPLGISAADMKMLEVSKVTREEIGAAFGVPGIFLNDTQSVDYSNAQTQEKILYSNTVCPKADRLADRITIFLLPLLGLKGLTFKFDYSGIDALQEDKLQRAQMDEIQIRSGIITINEVRERDGFKDKKAWGDAWWASAMLTPITSANVASPALPPAPVPAPLPQGNSMKALHTPGARSLIAKAFIAKTASQERKFAQATMKAFNKQARVVTAWVADGAKAVVAPKVRDFLDDDDLVENWHALYVAFGMQSAEEVAARYSMSVPDGSAILKWIKAQERTHSKYVNDTTADAIDKILSDLRAEGASIPDMVRATKEYFGGIGYRAERVARTEVISVNNMAAQNTYEENGVKEHEWLSTQDERTRGQDPNDQCDHFSNDPDGPNGQVRPINEPFDVSGEQLMYPGDPNGSAANTINCRCTELPVI